MQADWGKTTACSHISTTPLTLHYSQINDTLQKLYLSDNPIRDKGATAFAEMLLKNKSLKVLDLQDDFIGVEGTQKLIDSLTHNITVVHFQS